MHPLSNIPEINMFYAQFDLLKMKTKAHLINIGEHFINRNLKIKQDMRVITGKELVIGRLIFD